LVASAEVSDSGIINFGVFYWQHGIPSPTKDSSDSKFGLDTIHPDMDARVYVKFGENW